MFELMEIIEYIYEGVVNLPKNLQGNMTTVMVTEGKLEDNPPRKILSTR